MRSEPPSPPGLRRRLRRGERLRRAREVRREKIQSRNWESLKTRKGEKKGFTARFARDTEGAEKKIFPLAAEPPARGKFPSTSCLLIGASYLYFVSEDALMRSPREAPIVISYSVFE